MNYLFVIMFCPFFSFAQTDSIEIEIPPYKEGTNYYEPEIEPYVNWDSILLVNPNCHDCYIAKAKKEENFGTIIKYYKKALKIVPNSFEAFNGLGEQYAWGNGKRNYITSRGYYYKALKTFKHNDIDNFAELSGIVDDICMTYYYQFGENESSHRKGIKVKIAIWDSLIKSYNINEYYEERARAKRNNLINDSKGALSDYLYIYNHGEYQNYEITWAIAACYLDLLNYLEALKFYNKTIGILKEQKTESVEFLARLYSGKAECKMKLEDYRGANEDYQISLSKFLSQKDPSTLRLLQTYTEIGRSELLLRNYENAIYFLNKAIKYDDKWMGVVNGEIVESYDLSIAYYLLGWGYYYNSKNNEACIAWSKSGDLGNKQSYKAIKENCK